MTPEGLPQDGHPCSLDGVDGGGFTVGVGRSLNHDARRAGTQAATEAIEQLGGSAPNAVLVFASAAYDQAELIESIVAKTGDAPLCGCTGEGVITQSGSDECSHVVAVMAISAPSVTFRTFAVAELAADSEVAGRKLAEKVAPHASPDDLLVLFPDGVHGNCRKLLAALERGLENGKPPPTIVGGTAGDLFQFERTYQYRNDHAFSDGVAALLISGVDAELVISHGCDLVGEPQTITKTDGCFIEEIDGQRAWDLFKGYLDDDADTLEAMHVAHLLLAERIRGPVPESFAPFTVRVPVRLDASRGALYFAAGLEEGTPVQVALRNPDKVCDRAIEAAQRLVTKRGRPALMLQLDCAGRGRLLFDEQTTARIVEPVQQAVGKDVPWLGLHTYGEIAPVGTETLFHNYTGVLCALYPRT